MKNKIIVILLLILPVTETYAKDILHAPVIGEYVKQQVTYLPIDNAEGNQPWDLSKIHFLDKDFHVSNERCPFDEKIIVGTLHDTRYSYQSKNDSLLLWGYENHTSTIRYNMPEVIYRENLGIGEHTDGFFHGIEMYSGKLAFRIFGSYDFEVIGRGTATLPTGDSLRNVTLTHYMKTISKIKYPKIKSLEQLENYVLKNDTFGEDSIIQYKERDDAIIIVHQYKWYAEGYRYPIYETITTSTNDKEKLYETAYYFSLKEQEQLYDEPNEKLRLQLASSKYEEKGNGNKTRGEEGINISGKIEGHSNVSITIDSPVSAQADMAVYTSNGILVYRKNNFVW